MFRCHRTKVRFGSPRLAKLEGTVEARERDLPARLDRMELKLDRILWFILASWLTTMLALIGDLYFR